MTDPFERAVMRERLEKGERVARRVQTAWTAHLRVYLAVNALLFVIWVASGGPDAHPWFVYPLAGWGLGLYFHWASTRTHMRRYEKMQRALEE